MSIPESRVIEIWQEHLLSGNRLAAEDGEPIEVIYPGRHNDDCGADFRDAVIATSRGLMRGHIEIHAKSSDWRTHGHHLNPVYNQVVLHVALSHDTKANTTLQNGGNIPVVALDKHIGDDAGSGMLLCRGVGTTTTITEYLDIAGELRFQAKVAEFEADLVRVEAGQCLYQGIMGALGYAKNKPPFLELARRAPLQLLESLPHEISEDEYVSRLQALLLGTAGLLPSQRPNWHGKNGSDDEWIGRLERLWAESQQVPAMSYSDWRLFKVRPGNFPVRRIAAISYLCYRYRAEGLLGGIIGLVNEASDSQDCHSLERALMVSGSGYWARHFDFGSGGQGVSAVLLGSGRAAEIVVNVLLPFALAWSKIKELPTLGTQVSELYHRCPKPAVNAVEKHMMNQLGLSGSQVNSARRQQGLIHIYNTLCTQGGCEQCPLKLEKESKR